MKRIMVTGGAGFIGSHLCTKLLRDGHEVLCVDNLYTGTKENIKHLMNHPQFEFMRHDVTFPLYVEVDEIYNLACPASPIHYQRDPVQTTKTSVHGAINLLGLAKRLNAKILQASTSEIYGDPEVHPQTEDYWGNVNPIGPRSCYDEGKRCAETLFVDYYRQHDLDIRIARIFNTYGPRMQQDDGRVVSNFITQVIRGEKITIYGDGSQTRSFCYVDDMVDGLIALMNSDYKFNEIGPVNLGNPDERSIKDLAYKVIQKWHWADSLHNLFPNDKIEYKELPQDDPTRRKPDIRIAYERLNWRPHIGIDKGLADTINYFREKDQTERQNTFSYA